MKEENINPQTTELITVVNRFNSSSDIINDPIFRDYLDKNISELHRIRSKRSEPKPGFRYARDWYDRMNSAGRLNFSYFIKNIESIWRKQSVLNSEERKVIKYFCDKSLHQTLTNE